MTKQLTLIDTQPSWRLDDRTRQIGKKGLAQARAALQAGLRDRSPGPPANDAPPPVPARRSRGPVRHESEGQVAAQRRPAA